LDATRLIDLLEDVDGLKREIQERMKRAEAVKQAKALLLEDAQRTEALNRKLAEIGRAVGGVHPGLRIAETPMDEAPIWTSNREMPSRDMHAEVKPWMNDARAAADFSPISWRKPEEPIERPIPIMHSHSAETMPVFLRPELALTAGEPSAVEVAQVSGGNWTAEEKFSGSSDQTQSGGTDQAAVRRLEEAERSWRQAEAVTLEAKALLERSISEMQRVRSEDDSAAAELRTIREELLAATASAKEMLQQLKAVEVGRTLAGEVGGEANPELDRSILERSISELVQAQAREEAATTELNSARQELTTAYQFAAVAAQRRQDANEFFHKAARWAILSAALSWAASAWFGWFAVRAFVPIWAPGLATLVIVGAAMMIGKKSAGEV
jgi:hypothetical protein